MSKIFNTKKADYDGMQLWLNPVDKTVYAWLPLEAVQTVQLTSLMYGKPS